MRSVFSIVFAKRQRKEASILQQVGNGNKKEKDPSARNAACESRLDDLASAERHLMTV